MRGGSNMNRDGGDGGWWRNGFGGWLFTPSDGGDGGGGKLATSRRRIASPGMVS